MFIVLTTYIKPLEVIEARMHAHMEYLDEQYRDKKIIFSGRRNPLAGEIILFNIKDRNEVWQIIENDPLKLDKCVAYDVLEFTPTKHDGDFETFVKKHSGLS